MGIRSDGLRLTFSDDASELNHNKKSPGRTGGFSFGGCLYFYKTEIPVDLLFLSIFTFSCHWVIRPWHYE